MQTTEYSNPREPERGPLTVPAIGLRLPSISQRVIDFFTTDENKNFKPEAIRVKYSELVKECNGEPLLATYALPFNLRSSSGEEHAGGIVQIITRLHECIPTEGDSLTIAGIGCALLKRLTPDLTMLCCVNPGTTGDHLSEYIAVVATLIMLSEKDAPELTRPWYELALGELFKECDNQRHCFESEPRDSVVKALTELADDDDRIGSLIARVSRSWNELQTQTSFVATEFFKQCVGDRSFDEAVSSLVLDVFDEGILPQAPESASLEVMNTLVKGVVARQVNRPEWTEPFVAFGNEGKFATCSVLLDLSRLPYANAFSPDCAHSCDWAVFESVFLPLTHAGIEEWRIAVRSRDLTEVLQYLDSRHISRSVATVVHDMQEYIELDCPNLSLASFWGITDPRPPNCLVQLQHWIRQIDRMRERAAQDVQRPIGVGFVEDRDLTTGSDLSSDYRSMIVTSSRSIRSDLTPRTVIEVRVAKVISIGEFEVSFAVLSAVAELAQEQSLPPGTLIGIDNESLRKGLQEVEWPVTTSLECPELYVIQDAVSVFLVATRDDGDNDIVSEKTPAPTVGVPVA